MADSIENYADLRYSTSSTLRPKKEEIKKLRDIKSSSVYFLVLIKNNSKKQIEDVTLNLKDHDEFVSDIVMDGAKSGTFFGKSCRIGHMRPQSLVEVHVWARYLSSSDDFEPDLNSIIVTAKEYDSVSTDYPLPGYAIRKYYFLPKSFVSIFFPASFFFLGVIISFLYSK